MTTSAAQFIESVHATWDSRAPWEATAEAGYLAEPDEDTLRELCEKNDEDYKTAAAEVMTAINSKIVA